MASKSKQIDTKKYSGVVKSVKDAQPQEEPRITADQVIKAFNSFGFEPNERNHNDIGYWTMKPISDAPKLMEELHKRRMDLNKEEDSKTKSENEKQKVKDAILNRQNIDKTTMPRLSDDDINALFDEYGLPPPDPEWARNHLPNDPKKIRSILEMQRKMADDMMKKNSKNTVNSIPEVPKMSGVSAMQPAQPPMGMGGPTSPMGIQGGLVQGDSPVTPFFVGDNALVRITNTNNPNSGTYWLVDKKRKVLRPIGSQKVLEQAFEDPQEAINSVITLSSQALGAGGPLEGFTPLNGEKGIREDGTMDKIDFSPAQIQKRYGKQSDPNMENKALSMIDGLVGHLNKLK